jgi:crotonobetainyl-CoA:carnitine CoA-transferase CaiB-like acyl-CoA transferase
MLTSFPSPTGSGIVARIQSILIPKPCADWLAFFAAAGVPAGPIYRVDEVSRDPMLRERGCSIACLCRAKAQFRKSDWASISMADPSHVNACRRTWTRMQRRS